MLEQHGTKDEALVFAGALLLVAARNEGGKSSTSFAGLVFRSSILAVVNSWASRIDFVTGPSLKEEKLWVSSTEK
jgi:hypothetical protein